MFIGLEALTLKMGQTWGRIGLLSNQASLDRKFKPSWQLVLELFGTRLTTLFGPQHGFYGTCQDNMIETNHEVHLETGLPLYSLYSEVREPTEVMLRNVDTLIIDLQITGCRIYTWKSSIAGCLRSAKKYGKKIVVLDRPNPVGGVVLEGKTLDLEAASFVGQFCTPMRHGLTAGESANLFNREIGAELEVISMQDWNPSQTWDVLGRQWVMTSPNLPTIDSVHTYPGTVIFEGTNLSEGRGTSLPFQLFGAPYISDSRLYVERVIDILGEPPAGVVLRPTSFQPTFHKWSGVECKGLQIHVADPNKVASYKLSIAMLKAAMEIGGDEFLWKDPPYEYDMETLPMKLIIGSHSFEKHLESDFSINDEFWTRGICDYMGRIDDSLLYSRRFEIR